MKGINKYLQQTLPAEF